MGIWRVKRLQSIPARRDLGTERLAVYCLLRVQPEAEASARPASARPASARPARPESPGSPVSPVVPASPASPPERRGPPSLASKILGLSAKSNEAPSPAATSAPVCDQSLTSGTGDRRAAEEGGSCFHRRHGYRIDVQLQRSRTCCLDSVDGPDCKLQIAEFCAPCPRQAALSESSNKPSGGHVL